MYPYSPLSGKQRNTIQYILLIHRFVNYYSSISDSFNWWGTWVLGVHYSTHFETVMHKKEPRRILYSTFPQRLLLYNTLWSSGSVATRSSSSSTGSSDHNQNSSFIDCTCIRQVRSMLLCIIHCCSVTKMWVEWAECWILRARGNRINEIFQTRQQVKTNRI